MDPEGFSTSKRFPLSITFLCSVALMISHALVSAFPCSRCLLSRILCILQSQMPVSLPTAFPSPRLASPLCRFFPCAATLHLTLNVGPYPRLSHGSFVSPDYVPVLNMLYIPASLCERSSRSTCHSAPSSSELKSRRSPDCGCPSTHSQKERLGRRSPPFSSCSGFHSASVAARKLHPSS